MAFDTSIAHREKRIGWKEENPTCHTIEVDIEGKRFEYVTYGA